MTLKNYQKIRIAIVILISMIFSFSITMENFFIPVITLLISWLILLYFRKQITDVIADERDYQTGGKAAMLSIQIYSWIAVIAMFLLYSMKDTNPAYEAIANTLAFSTCILMLLYSIVFRYYNKVKMADSKAFFFIASIIIIALVSLAAVRVLSGEDNWICENGEWISHGQPSFEKPKAECK